MVQRKVSNKLGIRVDHARSEKRLGSLGPSSPRHQDCKNRGADLKKKMKKLRSSIKPSDFESPRSPVFRREVPQPGKPPPAESPQKQSPTRKSEASPNYMKSTSSSEARKERSPVSSRSFQTSINSISPKKILSSFKLGKNSGHKLAKTLARSSSLKLVRALTKSPSFKTVRASAKKCSQAVFCENLNAQKATCSSTLKDSKFPSFLALSPGATESERTTVMKVCPYTYCSLNGHRHAPLPPIKCFLLARRRMLAAPKEIKMGCLSPCRAKSSDDGTKEITEPITPKERPTTMPELGSNFSKISPIIQENRMDFFIEIYTILSDEATCSDGKFEEDINESSELDLTKMDIFELLSEEERNVKLGEEENIPECINNSNLEAESPTSAELVEKDIETSDVEWEEGQCSGHSLDDDVCNLAQTNYNYDYEISSSVADEDHSFHNESIFMPDVCIYNEITPDEGVKDFCEQAARYPSGGSNSFSDSKGSSLQVFGEHNFDVVSLTYDAVEESPAGEKDEDAGPNDLVATTITLMPVEEPTEEPRGAREDENKDFETDSTGEITELQLVTDSTSNFQSKDLVDFQEHESHLDYEANALPGNQEFDSSFHMTTELHQDATSEDYSSDATISIVHMSIAVGGQEFLKSAPPGTDDLEIYKSPDQQLPSADVKDGTEEQESAASLIGVPTLDILQELSEADQKMALKDCEETQTSALEKNGEPNQAFVDAGYAGGTVMHVSDRQSQTNSVAEDQNHPEKDCSEAQRFKVLDSMDSDNEIPGLKKLSVCGNNNEDVNDVEVEQATTSGLEESLPSSKDAASSKEKSAFSCGGSHSSQELPKPPYNLRIVKGKRPIEELDETRKFNPREPNYLPVKPDPEAEKVDLKHQMVDERKNAEEWMLDYALQQTVTKLAPARKRKVALLVEAFEEVMPMPKYQPHLRQTSATFAHSRAIQAFS